MVSLVYYLWSPGELPPQSSVREYVNDLIACYTDLVTVHYSLNPDFGSLRPYFRLYNDSTHSYNALVMPAYPSNISNTVALIFEPINASKTTMLFDYGDTFQQLYTNSQLYAYRFIIPGGTLDFNGNPAQFNLAFNLPPENITNNTFENASREALSLFNQDASKLPSYRITATQATCTSPPRTPGDTFNSFLNWFNHNILTETLGTILTYALVAALVVAAITAVFHKRVVTKLKELADIKEATPTAKTKNAESTDAE